MDLTDEPLHTGPDGTAWHFSILGGLKKRDRWTMPKSLRFIGILGGVNADMTDAVLPENPTLIKISLIGGVSLRVPGDLAIDAGGFRIFGGTKIDPPDGNAPARNTLKVRCYGLAGGIRVER